MTGMIGVCVARRRCDSIMLGAAEGMAKGGEASGAALSGMGFGVGIGMAGMMQPGQQRAPVAPMPVAAGGSFCPGCGTSSSGKFCSNCGTALAPPTKKCASCQAELAANARFCAACGQAASP